MNNISRIALLLLIFAACKKGDSNTASIDTQRKAIKYVGALHAMMNDSLWTAIAEGYYDSTLMISGGTTKDGLHFDNALIFDRLSKTLGLQPLRATDRSKPQPYDDDSTSRFFTAEPHGNWDVGGDYYDVLNSDTFNNYFNITGLSNHDSEITGIFSVTVVRIDSVRDSQYPDTIRFRNGSFTLKVSK
jgi:hypothetical protein